MCSLVTLCFMRKTYFAQLNFVLFCSSNFNYVIFILSFESNICLTYIQIIMFAFAIFQFIIQAIISISILYCIPYSFYFIHRLWQKYLQTHSLKPYKTFDSLKGV